MLGLLVPRRHFKESRLAQEAGNAVRWPGADPQPVLDALFFEDNTLRVFLGDHRIIGPHSLDKSSVAGFPGIGDDNAIKGALFGAGSGQADTKGHGILAFLVGLK